MKRMRSPEREKQLDYAKQQRGFAEYTQTLRHGKWRKNKRRPAQQRERQAGRIALGTAAPAALRDAGFDPGQIQRPRIAKWGPTPLGSWVESRQPGRVARALENSQRRPRGA
jgi:hypothetical protein